jgi:hypothetical protein
MQNPSLTLFPICKIIIYIGYYNLYVHVNEIWEFRQNIESMHMKIKMEHITVGIINQKKFQSKRIRVLFHPQLVVIHLVEVSVGTLLSSFVYQIESFWLLVNSAVEGHPTVCTHFYRQCHLTKMTICAYNYLNVADRLYTSQGDPILCVLIYYYEHMLARTHARTHANTRARMHARTCAHPSMHM